MKHHVGYGKALTGNSAFARPSAPRNANNVAIPDRGVMISGGDGAESESDWNRHSVIVPAISAGNLRVPIFTDERGYGVMVS